MNLERAALKGRLEEAKNDLRGVELRGDALINQIRPLLDPYADTIADVDTATALVLMGDLAKLKDSAVALQCRIKEFEGDLNG